MSRLLSKEDIKNELEEYKKTASEFNKDALSLENTQKELDEGKNLSVYGIEVTKSENKKGGKKKTRRMKLKNQKSLVNQESLVNPRNKEYINKKILIFSII